MKISTKGRYGLRAIIDLATHSNEGYVSLNQIANRQDLSINYLEHAFAALKKAEIISGMSGSQGGYKLNDDPKNITIKKILDVLEGKLTIADINNSADQTPLRSFIDKTLWQPINENIDKIIEGLTLSDMVDRYSNIGVDK